MRKGTMGMGAEGNKEEEKLSEGEGREQEGRKES